MKTLFLAAAALCAGGIATGAAAQMNSMSVQTGETEIISDARSLMYDYDVESIVPVLQEIGLRWEGRTAPGGEKVIIATAPNSMKFVIMPTACSGGVASDCAGISMTAVFGGTVDQRTINSFNYRYPFTSAGVDDSGMAFINRYEIADYGVPRGNFVTSIYVFLTQAKMLAETITTATETVSQESYVGDFAANSLNMNQIFADADVAAAANMSAASHEASLEAAADFVGILVEADKQSPGKIVNFTNKN